jgi:hypothetical protein
VSPHPNTGSLKINRKVVIIRVQTKRTRFSNVKGPFPQKIVVKKLNLPTNLETPAICRLKIVKSTEIP